MAQSRLLRQRHIDNSLILALISSENLLHLVTIAHKLLSLNEAGHRNKRHAFWGSSLRSAAHDCGPYQIHVDARPYDDNC